MLLAGDGAAALDGSEYQKLVLGRWPAASPLPTWCRAPRLHRFLAEAAERRLLRSAHDVADGGLAVTLAESAIAGGIGVVARLDQPFSEGDGRAVISVFERTVDALSALAGELPLRRIGRVGGDAIVLPRQALPLTDAAGIYESALPAAVEGSA